MPATYHLEIVAPDRTAFAGEVSAIVVPGVEGYLGVLAHHAPMLAELGVGMIKVTTGEGETFHLATGGGFLEVMPDHAVVLADSVERVEEIDVARAQAALQRAQERLQGRAEPDVDVERAQAALQRALNRLRIAEERTPR